MAMLNRIRDMLLVIVKVKNFHLFFLDYLRFMREKTYLLRLRNGLKVYIRSNSSDKSMFREIFCKNSYRVNISDFNKPGIVIDMGANIGLFSIALAYSCRHLKIFAFEPEEGNFDLFKKQIEVNALTNIVPIKKAVGSKNGKMKLFKSTQNTVEHTLISDAAFLNQNKTLSENFFEEVDVLSFNDIVRKFKIEKIDLLKVDIEGGEYDVFSGMTPAHFDLISRISMEYHFVDNAKNGEAIEALLKKEGFEVINQYPMIYASNKGEAG